MLSRTSSSRTDALMMADSPIYEEEDDEIMNLWNMESDEEEDWVERDNDKIKKDSTKISSTTSLATESKTNQILPIPRHRRRRPHTKKRTRFRGEQHIKTQADWDIRMELVRQYHKQHGHIQIPYSYRVNVTSSLNPERKVIHNKKGDNIQTIKLGSFIHWLRTLNAENRLQSRVPPHIIQELNTTLNMRWEYVGRGRRPYLFYKRLQEWKEWQQQEEQKPFEISNMEMNKNDTDSGNAVMDEKLGLWIWKQRREYEKLRKWGWSQSLRIDQVDALEKAGGILPDQQERIIPQQYQHYWTQLWQVGFQTWCRRQGKKNDTTSIAFLSMPTNNAMIPPELSDEQMLLWFWEQWRMYNQLLQRGPGKTNKKNNNTDITGDLPILLTSKRIAMLQIHDFFRSEDRPFLLDLTPPDLDVTQCFIEWTDVVATIRQNFDVSKKTVISPLTRVHVVNNPGLSLYSLVQRLRFEYQKWQANEPTTGFTPLLETADQIEELRALGFSWQLEQENDGDIVTPLVAEYQWWQTYHELKREMKFKRDNANYNQNNNNKNLTRWIAKQRERQRNIIIERSHADSENTPHENNFLMQESHFEALVQLGIAPLFNTTETAALSTTTKRKQEKDKERTAKRLVVPVSHAAQSTRTGKPMMDLYHDIMDENERENLIFNLPPEAIEAMAWEKRLQQMKDWIQQQEHTKSSEATMPPRLSLWAYNQRVQYKQFREVGRRFFPLTLERIEKLNAIGFDWKYFPDLVHLNDKNKKQQLTAVDEEMLQEMKQFVKEHGHCFVPLVGQHEHLGSWVNRQRVLHREAGRSFVVKKSGKSNKRKKNIDLVECLVDLGLDFNMDHVEYFERAYETLWEEYFQALSSLLSKNDNISLKDIALSDPHLAKWWKEQYAAYWSWKNDSDQTNILLQNDRCKRLEERFRSWLHSPKKEE